MAPGADNEGFKNDLGSDINKAEMVENVVIAGAGPAGLMLA